MTKVIVVNGPNLGRLGVRQPDVYGRQDLETLRTQCSQWGAALGLKVEVRQTDDEAEMVRWMHQAVDEQTPVEPFQRVVIIAGALARRACCA